MGEKSQARVLAGIEALGRRQTGRMPLGDVWHFAQEQLSFLRALPGVTAAEAAGSLRRMRDTVGDLDILVAAADSEPVMDAFASQPIVSHMEGRGPTKTSVEFSNGLRAQVWVHPPERFGTALQYATGSKDHNVKVREQALKKGYLTLRACPDAGGRQGNCCAPPRNRFTRRSGCPTSRRNYAKTAARSRPGGRKRPARVDHTCRILSPNCIPTPPGATGAAASARWSKQPSPAAAKCWRSPTTRQSLGIGNGLTVERLMAQKKEIEALRQEFEGRITILHGTEMEIKTDGTLDFPDEVLARVGYRGRLTARRACASRASRSPSRMLTAIRNPHVDIIGHPTNRLLPDRAGSDLDMEAIFQAALEHGTALEINANPQRLDLNDIHARRAIELGVPLAINTDAHAPEHLDLLQFGVATARRGLGHERKGDQCLAGGETARLAEK